MRYILIIFFFFFFLNETYSQQFTTKLYGNIFSYVPELDDDNIYDNLSFGIEYQTKKNHIHEFEVLSIDFLNQNYETIDSENQIYTSYYNRSELAFRYKYKTILFRKKNNLSFYLSASPLFIYTKSKDSSNYMFMFYDIGMDSLYQEGFEPEYRKSIHTHFTSSISLIPTVNYNYKDFIDFNISIPLDIFTFEIYNYEGTLYDGTYFKSNFFPLQLYVKLGIGFRIYNKSKHKSGAN